MKHPKLSVEPDISGIGPQLEPSAAPNTGISRKEGKEEWEMVVWLTARWYLLKYPIHSGPLHFKFLHQQYMCPMFMEPGCTRILYISYFNPLYHFQIKYSTEGTSGQIPLINAKITQIKHLYHWIEITYPTWPSHPFLQVRINGEDTFGHLVYVASVVLIVIIYLMVLN